jgi:uncharacterized protein (TIGR03437 family)
VAKRSDPRHWMAIAAAVSGMGFAQTSQPYLYSVANSASYDTRALAQGSLIVLFGYAMGPDVLVQASSYPLQPNLAGTSVTVISGNKTLSCPMVYTSATVAAAILPSNTPVGQAEIIVTYNGQASGSPTAYYGPYFNVAPTTVGIYSLNSGGSGPGVFTTLDGSVKNFNATAKTGDILTLWATGTGPISADDSLQPPVQNVPSAQVYVGTQPARMLYAGRSPCCAGLDQISFEVPKFADGCFVPVSVFNGGVMSNFVTLSINNAGGKCPDASPSLPSGFYTRGVNGESLKFAMFVLGPVGILTHAGFNQARYVAAKLSAALHTTVSEHDAQLLIRSMETNNQRGMRRAMGSYAKQWNALDPKVKVTLREQANLTQDGAFAAFGTLSSSATWLASLLVATPPAGACTIFTNTSGNQSARSGPLDAGPSLTVKGPMGQFTMPASQTGQYQVLFGPDVTGPNVPPGTYTITGKGGSGVGSFTTTLSINSNLVWTNRAAISIVDRSQPLTITWSGGTLPGHVVVGGSQNESAFLCTEDAAKGIFSVPQPFLSTLTPSSPLTLFVGQHPLERQVTIPGLDVAYFIDASSNSSKVSVK